MNKEEIETFTRYEDPIIKQLQQENKQLKEKIDKATSETKRQLKRAITQEYTNLGKILEILGDSNE